MSDKREFIIQLLKNATQKATLSDIARIVGVDKEWVRAIAIQEGLRDERMEDYQPVADPAAVARKWARAMRGKGYEDKPGLRSSGQPVYCPPITSETTYGVATGMASDPTYGVLDDMRAAGGRKLRGRPSQ